ncbi:hypothetical protein [Streptomyces sp. Rer75]|uniref:hypothetical protein n=1 Tax=Streptomyces sp. Rer75 TaxID=2750011 RepID=UPI0015D03343|nr:hypothetical protein [Streptomyces sp. Rer75]QLH25383.1 hypothetical protein HYQ63_36140 [Streptomyces sp. Rer75]
MGDYVAALRARRDRDRTLTVLAEPMTAPHDGGALFPDDSGGRNARHATACVSRQYLGSRGHHRAATPYVGAVEPRKNCPLRSADLAGIVSLYGLRDWTEQDDKPVEHELG